MKPQNHPYEEAVISADVIRASQRLINACTASEQAITSSTPTPDKSKQEEDAVDEEFTAAEELAISLLRYYRNQKMISLVLDEIAEAVREGY